MVKVAYKKPIVSKEVQTTLEGKTLPEGWDFAKADTSYLTHGLHDYPARMIPQIAERLIRLYTQERDKILDPFCGSGTTLVESRLANRNAGGSDINPLAVLLAKVKSTPIDFKKTGFDLANLLRKIEVDHTYAKKNAALPEPPVHLYKNLLHWFKEPVARDLEFLYQAVEQVENVKIRDFLNIILSDTIFRTSNIDHRSSRFIRILPKEKLAKFNPDVIEEFRKKLIDSANRMLKFTRRLNQDEASETLNISVRKGDARKLPFGGEEFDAIITSPPYGEERNTVAYARWSKLSVAWLRLSDKELKESEQQALGAEVKTAALERLDELRSPTAVDLLRRIAKNDQERVKQALPFFFDYSDSLKEMYRVIKPEGFCCIVIGDRSIRRKMLDMEKVTLELGGATGFHHIQSFFREIPMKLIPWKTPTGKTISRESIVIFSRQ